MLFVGGAGFIGSNVAERLLKRGDRVVIVDEMNDYYDIAIKQQNLDILRAINPQIKIYIGDICDRDFITNVFEVERPTHICHLAARAGVRPSIQDPYIYVHSNIEGTTRMIDLARQYYCKNFVFASSSSVYGSSSNSVLSETDVVTQPVSPYAMSKMSCELLAYTFHHLYGINVTGLRFFTVYGPRGRPDMAPFKFIDRVVCGLPIQQYGDGSTSRDYTYITDIVSGVVAAIDTPLGYEIINLGNGRPFMLKDFISLVETCVGKKAVIEILPNQPGDVDHTCANVSKAQRLLGYNPQVTFEQGIANTFDWYRKFYSKNSKPQESLETQGEIEDEFRDTSTEIDMLSNLRRSCHSADDANTLADMEYDSNVSKTTSQLRSRVSRMLQHKNAGDTVIVMTRNSEG